MLETFQILSFLFLPLLSFVILIFFGKKLKSHSSTLGMFLIGLMLTNSIFLILKAEPYDFVLKTYNKWTLYKSFEWFSTGNFSISLGYFVDNITAIMLVVVSLIGFLVHLYSTEYMKDDPKYSRYFAFLGIFIFSMNGIVLADSLIMIYVFWELVGLSSFLLIGFWFEKEKPPLAANKAFLTNRVGDIGMFIGIMIIFFHVGSFNINEIINGVSDMNKTLLTLAGVLVFMGAVGKSAQFPLHIWLPNAMEGPTPVSALIHAATMVAAGVYLTFRIFPFLTPDALAIVAVIGAITAVMAAITAITRNDIKAVLAYSTISQLGYMVMAVGVGAPVYAFFHLVTHAMFKACLFLCSGSVIHAMHHSLHHLHDHETDPQDMNNMGGLKSKMPITHAAMLISTFAIAGVPFFSGFLSKDGILAAVLSYYYKHGDWTILLPIAGFGAAMITAFYMFRLIFKTFYGESKNKKIFKHIHESPLPMTIPLIILSVLSLAFAFTANLNPLVSKGWFKSLIYKYSKSHNFMDMKYINAGIDAAHYDAMYLSLFVASIGIGFSVLIYLLRKINPDNISKVLNIIGLFSLSKNKFYVDKIYNFVLYRPFLKQTQIASYIDWDFYDQKLIDAWGWITLKVSKYSGISDYSILDQKIIDGTSHLTQYVSGQLRKTQSGIIQNYLLGVLAVLVVIIILINQI
ncbi:MAG: NADH-quinone oxidoreductase subunit L [Candidatus Marinimicrobia bacterium]|nr:NADH-quinone oxidoreductase subunit L [Candidatus Neomarinimicrobiota bacterium]|tara:strand:- start:45051 stop:47108 length:2058 start_codon:yes stop_codon:yes gene_type:complete